MCAEGRIKVVMRRFYLLATILVLSPVAMLRLGGSGHVLAQPPPATDSFSAQFFRPAAGRGNVLEVDGLSAYQGTSFSAGFTLDYATRPLNFHDVRCDNASTPCTEEEANIDFVSHLGTLHIHGAVMFAERYQVSLVLPISLTTGEGYADSRFSEPVQIPGGTGAGLGDIYLGGKARFFGDGKEGLALGAAVDIGIPTGGLSDDHLFLASDDAALGARFVASYLTERFNVHANVGLFWQDEARLFNSVVGSKFTYNAGASYRIVPHVSAFAELVGRSGFRSEGDAHNFEWRVGATVRAWDFRIRFAGGTAVSKSIGSADFRGVLQLQYAPNIVDSDGDGIADDKDRCPTEKEDIDSWFDEDGCPEVDNDVDGLNDAEDKCPNQAEDMDEFQDEDGCPEEDNDGDGISDGFDACPNEPVDKDGVRDTDGCIDHGDDDGDGVPDPQDQCLDLPEDKDGLGDDDGCPERDFDGDGWADVSDKCPKKPEIYNGVQDRDGCPEPDRDWDGIPDKTDRCPDEAETLNGLKDDDGCPDGQVFVRVGKNSITLMRPIAFRGPNALLKKRARATLNALAVALKRYRHLQIARIESHVSSADFESEKALELTARRAKAVVAELVRRGVSSARLRADGMGSMRPLKGAGANEQDRIEVRIERRKPVPPRDYKRASKPKARQAPEREPSDDSDYDFNE